MFQGIMVVIQDKTVSVTLLVYLLGIHISSFPLPNFIHSAILQKIESIELVRRARGIIFSPERYFTAILSNSQEFSENIYLNQRPQLHKCSQPQQRTILISKNDFIAYWERFYLIQSRIVRFEARLVRNNFICPTPTVLHEKKLLKKQYFTFSTFLSHLKLLQINFVAYRKEPSFILKLYTPLANKLVYSKFKFQGFFNLSRSRVKIWALEFREKLFIL